MYEGSRYRETKDLDIVEVAKLIRKDLAAKKEQRESPLFGLKTSVRIQRYSMGQSIHLDAWADPGAGMNHMAIKQSLFAVAECYNYDRSDSQSDYFDVKFHVSTRVVAERGK